MGAGKSTAARAAAEALGVQAIDTDERLAWELDDSLEEFFDRAGEPEFRAREEQVVVDSLAGAQGAPVALGGGALGSARVRAALEDHTVVWLEVDPETAWSRATRSGGRPLARDRAAFEALHAERLPAYERAANAILPASDPEIVRAALPFLAALADAPAGTRMVWAHSASGDYPVLAGPALLETGWFPVAGRRFAVSDRNVWPLHGRHLEPVVGFTLLDPGEGAKEIASAELVWRSLAQQGATRDDLVVALGGGVVGDLAGFCAATYQRGVRVVQVPTTLVAQVDAAYGGKTGVDLPEAKNYVGAFHQPAAVLVDPAALLTLPEAELSAGYAEVLKTALIAGGPLWERVRDGAGGAAQPDVILACARVKLGIVAQDERDAGRRQVLNLGHTVGHAIETAAGYGGPYAHGPAVGLGLLAALRLSERDELRAQVAELLAAHGLPTRLEGVDPAAVVEAVRRDKKRRADGPVPFVIVEAPGDVREGVPIPEGEVAAAVRDLID
ncbi:MAG: shikimate kinase / 3-dehydroquinate synthase [Solirubrobacteraceae bacterium]|nr:shikimate kinase / 3-dehydroquinate synthase [Solirubrobacteraceae bacterium]